MLERAAGLYRGDLLPGCYDDWIRPERERLRQMAAHALRMLVDLLETQGDYRAAIGHCQVTQAADGYFNCLDILGRAGRIGLRGAGFLNYTVEVINKRQPDYGQPTTLRPVWYGDARIAMHPPQLEEFAKAIRESGSPAVTLAEARRVMEVLDAVFEAGRTGKVVCIE